MMKRTTAKILTTGILAGSLACQTEKDQQVQQQPNFIIFIADDAAWDDNGVYGHPHIKTPTIDQLAREGMTFTNAFLTTSSCSPSRCSILTGLYPHNTGAPELHMPLPADRLLFAGELKKNGYYTVSAGKWHLGPERTEFDSIYKARDASGSADWVRAVQNRPQEKPFFMWLAAKDPHRAYEQGIIPEPHQMDDAVVPPYLNDNDSARKDLALYYDEISRLDSNMKKVIDELKQQGIYENTLIIFMSDNGRPFPRDKTRMYDSGIKTPFIVSWPGKIQAGSVSNSLISSIDIAPTLCELAGAELPDVFQGESMAPVLSNPDTEIRDYIFAEHNWHDYQAHERAVRSKKHLYIWNTFPELNANPPADAVRSLTYQEMIRLYKAGELPDTQQDCFIAPRDSTELYDVEQYPYQMNNMIDDEEFTEIAKNMAQVLSQWRAETNDTIASDFTPDMFDRLTGEPLKDVKLRQPADF